ncbi:hypothetical protein [Microvirga lenta]|uniref:hypothetical protein n=1 Tax=Microvirga lenta TaxID=2881337 RepID=UPI001CFFA0BA|nr:hypothetical protein [Microvirga lenta]MCB5176861.1 hypothetical protein [Microvirga lenta]
MFRRFLFCNLLALPFLASQPVLAQSFPLGPVIDAIGRAQSPAPAPQVAPGHGPKRKMAPAGRAGRSAKPVRQPRYQRPGDSGGSSPGYLLGNG